MNNLAYKKNTPWKSANEFKKCKSTNTVGHPIYVYKKRGRSLKYLTFTHKPKKGFESDFEKLLHNIDPFDASDCYVSKRYSVTNKNAFNDADKRYRVHSKDKGTVKKYQK